MDATMSPEEREAKYWRTLMQAMGGCTPLHSTSYEEREEMKQLAGKLRHLGKHSATARAGGWLLHALSHWLRAHEALMCTWPAEEYDDAFPDGMTFTRYLGAWMYSVARPQLLMSHEDIQAVHAATGMAMLPHDLLPPGMSNFRRPSDAAT